MIDGSHVLRKVGTGMTRLKRQLVIMLFLVAIVLVVLVNVIFTRSPTIGIIISIFYFAFLSFFLGRAFFDSEEGFKRFMLGMFLLISTFLLAGMVVVIVYELNPTGLALVLLAPLVLLIRYVKSPRVRAYRKIGGEIESKGGASYFSPVCIIPLALIGYCTFLLINARSGWVHGTVWDVVSPSFFYAYFLTAFAVIGLLFWAKIKPVSKLSIIVAFSVLSFAVFSIVLYPGNFGDAFDHLGWARVVFDYGSFRVYPWGGQASIFSLYISLKEKGLAVLTATVAKMLVVDVFWVHNFINPILWGFFIPSITYYVAKSISGKENLSLLAAFLTAVCSGFNHASSRSSSGGLGYIWSFMTLYFLLWYLKSKSKTMALPMAVIATVVSALLHFLTGTMSFIFLLLAIALKRYENIKPKSSSKASLLMFFSLLGAILVIPALFGLNNIIYLNFTPPYIRSAYEKEVIAFSVEKLIGTDVWALIFGEYVNFSFEDLILSGIFPVLGTLGLVYALTKKNEYKRVLTLFMLLAFITCLIDYRILQYAMVNVLFGPRRLWHLRDLMAIPFAATIVIALTEFLGGGSLEKLKDVVFTFKRWSVRLSARHFLAVGLLSLSLSAFAVSSMHESYVWLGGLQPTQLEIEAVEYIDEHTDGRYIVITMPNTAMIGGGFVGVQNPEKYYVYSWDLGMYPSVKEMVEYMRIYAADVGYFVASSFRTPEFNETIAEASRIFGLSSILRNENGEIYIFNYNVPPLPISPDVMAFHWHTPPSYYIQNDLFRVIFNPMGKNLDVGDFWGELYESIDLNKTLVDGQPIGNLTSIEYYDSSGDEWVSWDTNREIPLVERFEFKLHFESGSLIGVVEEGRPYVQLRWESTHASTLSLRVGAFSRLYIPGLVGGEDSYDVISREFGLFYTSSRTENVMLRPAYGSGLSYSSLTYTQIVRDCDLIMTDGYLWYDLYVDNNAKEGQWCYIEVWMPDKVYMGIYPPIHYSIDGGKTWIKVIVPSSFEPIRTLGGVNVNWGMSRIKKLGEKLAVMTSSTAGEGGSFKLPENFTDSGGGQNRLIFGLYLPAGDSVLLRLGASIYYSRPLKITYVFKDSYNISYGLRNMNESFISFYDYGVLVAVGGLALTMKPASLAITQDETQIKSVLVTIPSNTSFSLFSARDVDTTIDEDNDGIPDYLETMMERP